MPIVTEPRRKSPLPTVAVGKCVSKSRRGAHFSPHSSIIHLRPSPRTFSSSIPPSTFAPTRDPCSFIRIPGVSSRGIRRRDTGLRSVRARYIRDSTCTPISNLNAYPRTPYVCVAHVSARMCTGTHRPVGERRTWAWHYRECNIKLK